MDSTRVRMRSCEGLLASSATSDMRRGVVPAADRASWLIVVVVMTAAGVVCLCTALDDAAGENARVHGVEVKRPARSRNVRFIIIIFSRGLRFATPL